MEIKNTGLFNSDFEQALADVINIHSVDNAMGMPDFILSSYLVRCLFNFDATHGHALRHRGITEDEPPMEVSQKAVDG